MKDDLPGAHPDPITLDDPHSLTALLFTSDRAQRRCMKAMAIAAFAYAICIGVLLYGITQNLFAARPAALLAALMGATVLVFYLLIRSGLNKRFAEPTLTLPQSLVAQTLVGCAYAVTGPVHAANLMLFGLVMTFGMFDAKVRNARLMAAYSTVVAGSAMWWGWYHDPVTYAPTKEIVYFVLAVTVLTSISQLSVVLTLMRTRIKKQKAALEQALAQIKELATHDELTGLANRRHILDLLHQHALRHKRGGPSFYVAMVDLDHFKKINDEHGHGAGDDALRAFARQAQAQLRNTDAIGRWGGEEFLILMPETPPGDPNVGLERLRANLAEHAVSAQLPHLRVRFSAGLSRYREGEAVGDTIERADRAVYAAKAGGRNCTMAL